MSRRERGDGTVNRYELASGKTRYMVQW